MAEEHAFKAFIDGSFISDAEKAEVMRVYRAEGKAAALAAFDAAAAPELKTRIKAYRETVDELDRAVDALSAQLREEQERLEAEHVEALKALPAGHSKERDAAWEVYYEKCDNAREAHEKKARETISRIAGLPR